jgi:mono/diheme cytochrome c family protein
MPVMQRSPFVVINVVLATVGLVSLVSLAWAQSTSWTMPAAALEEKSPLTPTADVLKKGKALFGSNCRRCHGPEGQSRRRRLLQGVEWPEQADDAGLQEPAHEK